MKAKNHVVEVRSLSNVYLAALPDDLSFRMIKLLSGGNTYQALITTSGKSSVTIFIRELSRSKHFEHQPSFASTGMYMPFSTTEKREKEEEEPEESQAAEE